MSDDSEQLITHHSSPITLTGVAHGGEAVGRVGDLVAFVSLGLPGERVAFEVLERRPRYVRGRTVEVLEAAPARVTPPCPIFGTCGGCHWQHASYQAQLELKTAVLREQLARVARIVEPPVEPAVPSPLEWHYRNTVQLVPDREHAEQRLLCFQRSRSHDLVPVEHCYIADQLINRAIADAPWGVLSERTWAALEGVLVRVAPERALQLTFVAEMPVPAREVRLFAEQAGATLPELAGVLVAPTRGGAARVVWGNASLEYELAGSSLEVPAGAFFQVNVGAAARLAERVVDWLEPAPGDAGDAVLDAYAGVGTLTLPLARRAAAVLAVEAHPPAAEAAARNAARNGLANVAVQPGQVEDALAKHRGRVDLAVVDPPRRGCSPQALRALAALRPRRLAYVSCEPSTLARDVRLLDLLGYRLARACVIDLFPQTFHLETLALLEQG